MKVIFQNKWDNAKFGMPCTCFIENLNPQTAGIKEKPNSKNTRIENKSGNVKRKKCRCHIYMKI